MALQTIEFEINGTGTPRRVTSSVHYGVVGSGDLEVLLSPSDKAGKLSVRVVTPVKGFDDLWRRVISHFAAETGLTDAQIEINDNNASPAVVALRLRQALAELPA
ncbi:MULTISPECIES: malonate decarboxylase acyl carrier protein [Rhodopseudomonas]|uniref:Malonate decarboxylase acyl carrier protein n=1 Tax=Rhodopseudomonas palustris TaxID=1076 RepID=A0A0D7EJ25_RHOPL|nr:MULTISPECIES: malonate decarboxylase acyl carrier protein [Rhodopseudomonas]KIZ40824.1 malonate decarboxylase subunit delta [Rhodopseudomonas palustris]MDF3812457.1 malonate decarboxylase acyl carrier protein [Rhodopseudomonas sp. BAL398]WOK19456.1 malonate decarboxylase acyl carrier protein [Rhodopseudomonas sp. BAL398]